MLLTDVKTGRVEGFSTVMTLAATAEGQQIVGVFSGDTVIRQCFWGRRASSSTIGTTLQLFLRLADESGGALVYWFLISSSYKTYRLLPLLFKEFYPTHICPTPLHVKRAIDALALGKYPAEYDSGQGVVRPVHATPFRSELFETTEQRLNDPHCAFFHWANPGHTEGDELACVAALTFANLTPVGRRLLSTRSSG